MQSWREMNRMVRWRILEKDLVWQRVRWDLLTEKEPSVWGIRESILGNKLNTGSWGRFSYCGLYPLPCLGLRKSAKWKQIQKVESSALPKRNTKTVNWFLVRDGSYGRGVPGVCKSGGRKNGPCWIATLTQALEHFIPILNWILTAALQGGTLYNPHFTEEETKFQRS